jgi:uncharacterized protein YceK
MLLLLLFSGCATVVSINDGEPYSGVKTDLYGIKDTFDTTKPWYIMPNWAAGILSTVDLPLSAVADTIVLPYTVFRPSRTAAESSEPDKITK